MKKDMTKFDDLYENATKPQKVQQYLQKDWQRQSNERRKDGRHLANIQLIEGVSEGLLRWNEKTHKQLEEQILERLTSDQLYRALRALKPMDRQILFLRYFCNWKLRQIAVLYEISESAVSQRIKKNLQNLQKSLQKNT